MKIVVYYYSATGCSKKIANAFARGGSDAIVFSVTESPIEKTDADLIVFVAPVYGGRIPKYAMDKFKSLCQSGKAIVGIAVYGNISFGASLKQYKKLAKDHDCSLVGIGAFIGRHTFSTKEAPISEDRPNDADIQQVEEFAQTIYTKMTNEDRSNVKLPFSIFPRFVEHMPESLIRLAVKSPIIKGECIKCYACVHACPRGAIDAQSLQIDNSQCSRCFACVNACNKQARRNELIIKNLKYPFAWIGKKERKNTWIS